MENLYIDIGHYGLLTVIVVVMETKFCVSFFEKFWCI